MFLVGRIGFHGSGSQKPKKINSTVSATYRLISFQVPGVCGWWGPVGDPASASPPSWLEPHIHWFASCKPLSCIKKQLQVHGLGILDIPFQDSYVMPLRHNFSSSWVLNLTPVLTTTATTTTLTNNPHASSFSSATHSVLVLVLTGQSGIKAPHRHGEIYCR